MGKQKIPDVNEARFREPLKEFTPLPNQVLHGKYSLSPGAVWLYALFRSFAYGERAWCYPTIGGLARIQDVTKQTIRNRLRELTKANLITVEEFKGYRFVYWIEPLADTPQRDLTGQADKRGHVLRRQDKDSKDLKKYENESLSLALELAETHSDGPQDRKALATHLSKFPVTVLEQVAIHAEKRITEGDIENPSGYVNRLATVFAEAETEAAAIREKGQRETLMLMVSTAEAERNSRTPERLREVLLEYWPGEHGLVDRAIRLVST